MMKFVDSSKIDKNRWNEIIASSEVNNITSYSWYLDAATEKWGAIINDDYSFFIPLPYKNRILYKQVFQHPFSRNLEFFGDNSKLDDVISLLNKNFKFRFHFNHALPFQTTQKVFQKLNLKDEIKYSTNTRRILKKHKDEYYFKITVNYENVLNFYFQNSFNKIKQQAKNKKYIQQVMAQSINHGKGEVIEAYNKNNELVGAAFYLKDKESVYYLIGDAPEQYKKKGIMYCIMDFAIQHYKEDFTIFDFGGSNVESVATFYRKLGGTDNIYFEYVK